MNVAPWIHACDAREATLDEGAEDEPVIDLDEGLVELLLGHRCGENRERLCVRVVQASRH